MSNKQKNIKNNQYNVKYSESSLKKKHAHTHQDIKTKQNKTEQQKKKYL